MKLEKTIAQTFLKTKPLKCSYIKDNYEERLLLPISKKNNFNIIDKLTKLGFRRNIDYMYLPVCKDCSKCISTRINVKDFTTSKSQKRNINKNKQIRFVQKEPNREEERYLLFRKYLQFRHSDGMMLKMTKKDFNNFFYNTPSKSRVYDIVSSSNNLVGSILLDEMSDALSAVYSFFDPTISKNGLGIYLILKSIEQVRKMHKQYLYLGYWVKESKKMNYKKSFNSIQLFIEGNWVSD